MQNFPHHYQVSATAESQGEVRVASKGLDTIHSDAPLQFGGPGNRWSPEELLVAAVADCFVLTFRAIANYSKLPWLSLNCAVDGTLDREDGVIRFSGFSIRAELTLPADGDKEKAGRLLEKAEAGCLITNSLTAEVELTTAVNVG